MCFLALCWTCNTHVQDCFSGDGQQIQVRLDYGSWALLEVSQRYFEAAGAVAWEDSDGDGVGCDGDVRWDLLYQGLGVMGQRSLWRS